MATTGGQTINDRLNAVRYALVGQGLARTVCKATTEEVLGPKKKHIDYLIACTNEPNVSIPQLANLLIERTQHTSWAVVFKSLTTIHHLMSFGNERFTQYLATSNHSFELADFMDRTTPQGYNMSNFVRRYAKYINDKSISYRTLAIDLCKIRSGNDNALRTMNMDNLSKTLPIVQAQFDSLLDFNVDSKDLNNGVILAAFRLLYKDLVRLYVAYQEAIINLLERYFKLSRKKTREALEMYKNYLTRMDKVAGFLRVVEAVGLDKSEMPDLTKSPASILKLLEQHLATLEARKKGATPADEEQTSSVADDANKVSDEQATSTEGNKENILPSSKDDSERKEDKSDSLAPGSSSSVAPVASKQAGQNEKSSTTSQQQPKQQQQPPTKPNRPVTPEVSPKSKPAAPAPPSSEKKAAPERPAKPPSRPPPPSASSPVESAGKRQSSSPSTTTTNTTASREASPKATAAASRPTPPHPPPPHPPPPTSHSSPPPPHPSSGSRPVTESSAANEIAATDNSATTASSNANSITQNGQEESRSQESVQANSSSCSATQQEININGTSNEVNDADNNQTNHKHNNVLETAATTTTTTSPATCSTITDNSTIVDNQTNQVNIEQESELNVESNHIAINNNINNNNNHDGTIEAEDHQLPPPPPPMDDDVDNEMPPPPPPIDDLQHEVSNSSQQVSEAPIINGSLNDGGSDAAPTGNEAGQQHDDSAAEAGDLGISNMNLQEES